MSAPVLLEVWLSGAFASCERRETLPTEAEMGVDVDRVEVQEVDGEARAVLVALTFWLARGDELLLHVDGDFRAIYDTLPEAPEERRAFACEVAPRDVWPVWRTWVLQTLAMMNLAPAEVPPTVPPAVEAEAREVFDHPRGAATGP